MVIMLTLMMLMMKVVEVKGVSRETKREAGKLAGRETGRDARQSREPSVGRQKPYKKSGSEWK